ncbi:cephalosporin hydroxylase family protein [Patescibacteria group bacterium]|nr:cephalosporin hydroxylase [Candidatus Falkowbacteria bacterium]MBU3906153.1 cephalosporin hydroxylase family protein [Patescibacteria group bacterium]MBU4014680.1 cephalosporin hydroxylase family protein [Patescibacteria group bacterium]MBU4026646.1 cephalosporin hydroxylase family protein [Patescibacteria group bacterium]MBU4073545.1 cephalosporin hydroxylase family protein [Patescibacteria group bacterium]
MPDNQLEQFKLEATKRAKSYQNNESLQKAYQVFLAQLVKAKYAYNFFWLGVPIIQAPQDLQALQEIIWEVKPDLIIETGIAWGGSILFNASMLTLLESCGKIKNGEVLGIDIDIRKHNKKNILKHPMSKKITMLEGSSIDKKIIQTVIKFAKDKKKILIMLDSNHTHDHVLSELRAYAPLVNLGSYIIVQDTGVEDLPEGSTSDRPWRKGNNPKTAVWEFLKENKKFKIDKNIESKLILTASPDGFLKRIK